MNVRKLNKLGITVLSAALMASGFAAQVESPFEVATWGDFAKGAISHTFDDWPTSNATQITASGMEAFNAKNLHMTIFVSTNGLSADNWKSLQTAFSHGHEVGSHNQQHNSDASGVKPSHDAIVKNVPGEKAVSMAYPNCNTPGDNEVLKYYLVGRNCNGQVNPKTPSNFAQIGAIGVGAGQGNYTNNASGIDAIADQAVSRGGWSVCMHHGIGTDRHSWATTNLDEMKKHLDYLDKNRDKIWCETFGNVARYIKERDAVTLSKVSSTDQSITISVKDNLDDEIFDYPLSISYPIPSEWKSKETVVVKQADKVVESKVVDGKVIFKAVPDAGDVVIGDAVSVLKQTSHRFSSSNPVVLKKSVLLVDRQYFNGSELSVTFFNLTGKKLGECKVGVNESSIALPADKITKSAFVAKISGGNKTVVQKFISQM